MTYRVGLSEDSDSAEGECGEDGVREGDHGGQRDHENRDSDHREEREEKDSKYQLLTINEKGEEER